MIWSDIVLGGALGGLLGALMAAPAVLLEWRAHAPEENLPLLVDIQPSWGKSLTHRELFLIALFVHLILAALFGAIYPIFVEQGWLFVTHAPYTIASLLVYAVGAWIVVGAIIFPTIRFGWFGRREGGTVWAEILATQLLLGLGIWLFVQWFRPWFFV